jgi:GntR family transcriptional regulator
MVNFSFKFKSGIPVYEQIIYVVKKAIISGQLKAGDPFPSVRELSKEFKVNPNTVQKAVAHLIREKMLTVKPGVGSSVNAFPKSSVAQQQLFLKEEIDKLVIDAKRLSITKNNLTQTLNKIWDKYSKGSL